LSQGCGRSRSARQSADCAFRVPGVFTPECEAEQIRAMDGDGVRRSEASLGRLGAWPLHPEDAPGSLTFAHVASFPARLANPPNAKRPREREAFFGATGYQWLLFSQPKLAAFRFHEPCLLPLGLYLPKHS